MSNSFSILLNVERVRFCERGAFLDKAEARFGLVAHELLDDVGGGGFVRFDIQAVQIAAATRDLDAQEASAFSGAWSFP